MAGRVCACAETIVNAAIERDIGRVVSVSGSEARIGVFAAALRSNSTADAVALTVGKFIGIRRNRAVLVGIISQVSTEIPLLVREEGYHAVASVDLMGEIISGEVTGDAAVFKVLRWTGGNFEMNFEGKTTQQSTTLNTQGLLMEGLRLLDESNREEGNAAVSEEDDVLLDT